MSPAARGRLNIRLLFVMFAMLAFAADVRVRAVNSSESSEQQLRAGYVYNFAKLVESPASVAPDGLIIVGVIGDDDCAVALGRVMASKTLADCSPTCSAGTRGRSSTGSSLWPGSWPRARSSRSICQRK